MKKINIIRSIRDILFFLCLELPIKIGDFIQYLILDIISFIYGFYEYLFKKSYKKIPVSLIDFDKTISDNFIQGVLKYFIKISSENLLDKEKRKKFIQEYYEVIQAYFCGRTFCVDVKYFETGYDWIDKETKDWRDTITITKNDCGWFDPDNYRKGFRVERRELTEEEKELYIELCKLNNIKFED